MTEHDPKTPEHIHLPSPSWQPLVLALGVLMLAIGILWTPVFSAIGVLVVLYAIARWTQENRDEDLEALDEGLQEADHE